MSGSGAPCGTGSREPDPQAVPALTGFDPSRLSDETIIVAFGWFSFGAKATVTSNPPHANMKARQAALDELLAANLITHEHETNKRYKIDRHHFKGTWALMDMLAHPYAKAVLRRALDERDRDRSGAADETRDAAQPEARARAEGIAQTTPEVSS